ncbi:MAG: UDP-N-acetylglucosamine 1-carboxyvinyltransferase [Vicingaceae bacterium]
MGTFKIKGGNKLKGELTPQGAKNEALQVVCAILLTSEKVTLTNLPFIRDVNFLIDLLEALGVNVEREGNGTVHFQANNINIDYLNSDDFKERAESLRGSIMIVGPLLARFKKAYMPKPGGDKIGARPLDTHFLGFTKLGATYTYDPSTCFYSLKADNLQGQYILLDEPSVTGTANILMTAVLAKGKTTIYNAACEPYLQQLCAMLNSMGAKISGVGSNLLTIEGVEELGGCEHRLLPDFIEVGSFIGLAAMTGSEITIKDCRVDMLGRIPDTFRRLGIQLEINGDDIHIPSQSNYEIKRMIDGSIPTIYDAVWPGFTPDLLSIVLVTAIQAKGTVLIHQKMFDSRLFFIDRLKDMGAQIILCDPHRATVIGMNHEQNLRGTTMSSPDIRAGVSLLIAALSAEGESTIHNIEQIDRGYQYIDDRLNAIGADITRL